MSMKDVPDSVVCRAVQESQVLRDKGRMFWPSDLLVQWTGEPEKVCDRALERAEKHGLVECGVSLRSGWLTEKGKALLREREQQ